MKYVKSDKPITTKHEKLGELSVEVEAPQYESVEEFVQHAGGADSALDYINGCVETNAKNVGRAALRNLPENAVLAEAVPKIQASVRDYAPTGGSREPAKAKKVAAFDSIKALAESGQEFTREQLLELLAAAK